MMCFPFYASFLIERYSAEVVDMEEKHHLLISRQTKDEKWLMPHIRPGYTPDLFAFRPMKSFSGKPGRVEVICEWAVGRKKKNLSPVFMFL